MHIHVIRGLFIGLLLCAVGAPALADTPVKRIKTQVTGTDGKPVKARIRVTRFDEFNDTKINLELPEGRYATLSNKSTEAWTEVSPDASSGNGGTSKLDITSGKDGKPLKPGFYSVEVITRVGDEARFGRKIVYIGPGTSATITLGPTEMRPIAGAQLVADVAGSQIALQDGNKSLYDDYRTSAEARIAEEAEDLSDLEAAIKAYRKANNIPDFRNARQVRKAIKAGQGTDLPVDPARVEILEVYEDLLRFRDFMKAVQREAKKLFNEIPKWPADKPKPKNTETSRLTPVTPAPQTRTANVASNISIRGGFNIGISNASSKGDLRTTTATGDVSGSDRNTDPILGLQMTFMMHNLAVQTAAFGSITPILHLFATQNIGGYSNVVDARLHPGTGNDSFVRFKRGFQAGAALGFAMALSEYGLCGLGSPEGCMDVMFWAGPLLTTMATQVITDERGGGGQNNSFTRNDTLLGAMLGAQFSYLVCATCQLPMYMTLGGQLNFTGNPDSASGRTSPFNFTYDGGVNPGAEAMIWLGVAFQLDQLLRLATAR